MAVIQTIREKYGKLVAIIIGIALLAFILGMFITEGGFLSFWSKKNFIGRIDRSRVKYTEFQNQVVETQKGIYARYNQMIQKPYLTEDQFQVWSYDKTWEWYLYEHLFKDEYKEIGIAFSNEDFNRMAIFQPDTLIFMNINAFYDGSGYNGNLAKDLKENWEEKSPDMQYLWKDLEFDLKTGTLAKKYNQLIYNGLYVNKLEIQFLQEQQSVTADISYIRRDFSEIPDSKVSVSDRAIKKFYKDNKEWYWREELRDLKYVSFPIIPTSADTLNAKNRLYSTLLDSTGHVTDTVLALEKFDTDQELKSFAESKNYVSYHFKRYTRDYFPEEIQEDLAFSGDKNIIYGPYVEDETWRIARFEERLYTPDSMTLEYTRIFFYDRTRQNEFRTIAAEMKNRCMEGETLDALVEIFNNERLQQYQNRFRPTETGLTLEESGFIENDPLAQAADTTIERFFNSELNDVLISEGSFKNPNTGMDVYYIQVSKITDITDRRDKVKMEVLSSYINASGLTASETEKVAESFFNDCFNKKKTFDELARDYNVMAGSTTDIGPMERYIADLPFDTRDMIRWAFGAFDEDDEITKGSLRRPKRYDDGSHGQFVVALVSGFRHRGYKSLDEVKGQIKSLLLRQKKSQILIRELAQAKAGVGNIEELAAKLGLPVYRAENVTFDSEDINGSAEYSVIAAAVNIPENTLSRPVFDSEGVYVLSVDYRETTPEPKTADQLITEIRQGIEMLVPGDRGQLTIERVGGYDDWIYDNRTIREELFRLAEIEDYRFRMY